jgi:hypothetical protein
MRWGKLLLMHQTMMTVNSDQLAVIVSAEIRRLAADSHHRDRNPLWRAVRNAVKACGHWKARPRGNPRAG